MATTTGITTVHGVEFHDEDLDRPIEFRADYRDGAQVGTGVYLASCWRIGFSPPTWTADGSGFVDGFLIEFARERDVLLAIRALAEAGIVTARPLATDRERVKRVIGEAMQW